MTTPQPNPTDDLEALRAIIDSATDAALPPVCDTTGNGTQLRAQIQCDIAANILAAVRDLRPAGVGEAVDGPEVGDDAVDLILSSYRAQINSTPALLSLLYDADMLPETATRVRDAIGIAAVCEAYKAGLSATPAHPDDALMERAEAGLEPFIAGPVWVRAGEGEDGEDVWVSEVQTVGGHGVVATVYGGSEAEVASRRDATLRALLSDLKAEAGTEPPAQGEG